MTPPILDGYRTHPVHHLPGLHIEAGYAALADSILAVLMTRASNLVILDGFSGVLWQDVRAALTSALQDRGHVFTWIATDTCWRPSEEIDQLLAPFLTDDPVFGRVYHGQLAEFWHPTAIAELRARVAQRQTPTVLYGVGASLVADDGVTVYIDVPKDRGQELARQGSITTIGVTAAAAFGAMYKRLYFVEWPLLSQIKRAVLPRMDIFVDGTNSATPLSVAGQEFRQALAQMAQQPFRLKPWFAPGPWGGQWMKDRFGLSPEQPNYAWSFELIAPENGLLFGDGTLAYECSFDYLLWAETDAVLGVVVAARYGTYFPIRFDYLDTMGGTNLSCQVHPRLDYIRDTFGEPFTQDETYYIVANEPGARVFLGLREDADVATFKAAAVRARDEGVPFAIEEHVASFPAQPHDLFLIPSGTVHCSGADNLVLEISATPYIYTFKIYDYLRADLRGNLRHVHLDHAFANLQDARRATWVQAHLRPQPQPLRQEGSATEYVIGDIPELFFGVHRLEFTDTIADATAGKFLALNLVAGERCAILTTGNAPYEMRFAETVIIPAAIGAYELRNTGNSPCKVVKAFVKG